MWYNKISYTKNENINNLGATDKEINNDYYYYNAYFSQVPTVEHDIKINFLALADSITLIPVNKN